MRCEVMIPNMDPRAMKRMMESMGMKNTEIAAGRVVIEGKDSDIVIDNPNVVLIEMQGNKIFQITGSISEKSKAPGTEISDEDIKLVKEQTGINDDSAVRAALEESNGDIAGEILKLKS